MSRHLKALSDAGWVTARAEGTSNLYSLTREDLDAPARKLWQLVRDQVGASPAAAQDQRRLATVLAERRTKSQEFFSSSSGQWDRLRDEMFGDRFHLAALGAFADPAWTVGDLGCGTGQVSAALAPFVARVIGVDGSAAMLQAAKKRLQSFENVELRRGDLEALPIDDRRLDAATLMLVLHHVPEPEQALAEVARVRETRRPRSSSWTCCRTIATTTGSRWGTSGWDSRTSTSARSSASAGFGDIRVVALPPDARAKGPALFVAAGRQEAIVTFLKEKHDMASVLEKAHPFAAAKAAGREPYKVKNLAEAEFGRKEIRLAEQEMPGLMALRRQYGAKKPLAGARVMGSPAHDDSDRGAHRDADRARRRRALGVVQHLLDAGSRGRGRRRRPSGNGRHGEGSEGHAGVRVEGRDARGVLVVHGAGARVA